FHSELIEPALPELEHRASRISHADPTVPIILNLTGRPAAPGELGARYWVRHAREPVLFQESMEWLAGAGWGVVLQMGPGTALTSLGKQSIHGDERLWLSSLPAQGDPWETIGSAAAQLFEAGVALDWHAWDRPWPRTRTTLPSYPLQRQ